MDGQFWLSFTAMVAIGLYQIHLQRRALKRKPPPSNAQGLTSSVRSHRSVLVILLLLVLPWLPYVLGHFDQPAELRIGTSYPGLLVGQRASLNVHYISLGPRTVSDLAHEEFCNFVPILDFDKKPISERMKMIEHDTFAELKKKAAQNSSGVRVRPKQEAFFSFLGCPVLEQSDFQMDGNVGVLRRQGMMLLMAGVIKYSDTPWPFMKSIRYARHCRYIQNNVVNWRCQTEAEED